MSLARLLRRAALRSPRPSLRLRRPALRRWRRRHQLARARVAATLAAAAILLAASAAAAAAAAAAAMLVAKAALGDLPPLVPRGGGDESQAEQRDRQGL